jgi:hypothetical protein
MWLSVIDHRMTQVKPQLERYSKMAVNVGTNPARLNQLIN